MRATLLPTPDTILETSPWCAWVPWLRFVTCYHHHGTEQFQCSRRPCGSRGHLGVSATPWLALDTRCASADELTGLHQELCNSHGGEWCSQCTHPESCELLVLDLACNFRRPFELPFELLSHKAQGSQWWVQKRLC